ncbi:4Fe-4S binding protein [Spirochaetota bacterium]
MKTKKIIRTLRRIVQAASAVFLLYIIWNTKYPLRSFISPELYFYIDPFVMILTTVAQRVILPALLITGITLMITAVFGRVFCGWICPLGALMDLVAAVKSVVMKKLKKKTEQGKAAAYRIIKYFILAVLFFFALFGIQFAWVFDPITVFVRAFSFTIFPFVNRIIDKTFMVALEASDFWIPLETFYNKLRNVFLDTKIPVFFYTNIILIIFICILVLVLIRKRFYCRYICPLGGMLAAIARFSPFKRRITNCKDTCSVCRHRCRMNAIRTDNTYRNDECILCLDCIADCPSGESTFAFACFGKATEPAAGQDTMSRSSFLTASVCSVIFLLSCKKKGRFIVREKKTLIRPPGALEEAEFKKRCIRCGNCMKVCPTGVLQPILLESGADGIWTPGFDTAVGYCEYECTLCTEVCPTRAIQPLTIEEKKKEKLGRAMILKEYCLPYAKEEDCQVCEEHCPVHNKAIKIKEKKLPGGRILNLPYVVQERCIGCALCEFKCPARPDKAIRVMPYV